MPYPYVNVIIRFLFYRFFLERLSNNLGDIPDLDWDLPFQTGFYPTLRYPNGVEFPARPNFAELKPFFTNEVHKTIVGQQNSLTLIKDYSRRLRDVIDEGVVRQTVNIIISQDTQVCVFKSVFLLQRDGKAVNILNEEGLDVLGNIVEGNADSTNKRFFGSLLFQARHLLGYALQPKNKNHLAPSALEHSETSLRDPAFYQLYKYINSFFSNFKNSLPAYTKEDLQFPGVSIKKVEFDKLVTHFDYFYSDISNAVHVSEEDVKNGGFKVRVRQYRINQKPFKYRIYVDSEKDQVASVRVYIGAKYDHRGEPIGTIFDTLV